MSQDKVTPIPRVKGTPRRMRPLIARVTYYLVASVGLVHILSGVYLYYEIGILGRSDFRFTLQPSASLYAIIEFFSGVFAIIAAYGLRRLAYWGSLSIALFGAFEIWNGSPLAQIVQFDLGILPEVLPNQLNTVLILIIYGLGVLIMLLGGFSFLGVRRHKRVAAELKA